MYHRIENQGPGAISVVNHEGKRLHILAGQAVYAEIKHVELSPGRCKFSIEPDDSGIKD